MSGRSPPGTDADPAQRATAPSELYVYDCGEVTTDLLAFGVGSTRKEAEEASLAASLERPETPSVSINHTHDNLFNEIGAAKTTVQQSLSWLETKNGLWAGLPWFHQVWSRDELIAAIGLPAEQQRQIIERYLKVPLLEGELPTFIGSGTTCADGVGWLALLAREYGIGNLSEASQQKLLEFLIKAREGLKAHRQAPHGLIFSGHNATWMDTIGREGYRLEIQCMYALVLEELHELTDNEEYEQERLRLLGIIRHELWGEGYLKDGLNDPTLRPNVFIAYILQPGLLSAPTWQSCFDNALKGLMMPWGGLSSIDTKHPDYHARTTGENNHSYHNGDSWFFVNNLAAIAMLRLNQRHFGKKVVEILQSSTEEILWENMIGQPGEISSAEKLESFGCGIQAFSGGTYLALLREFEDYSAGHDSSRTEFFWDSTAETS